MNDPFLIFHVEDSNVTTTIVEELIEDSIDNYQIMSFINGEGCINNLHHQPNIIILDYEMPGINGLETLKQVKKLNSAIPVIILSNHVSKQIKRRLKEIGYAAFYEKSFEGLENMVKYIKGFAKNSYQKNRQPKLKDFFINVFS